MLYSIGSEPLAYRMLMYLPNAVLFTIRIAASSLNQVFRIMISNSMLFFLNALMMSSIVLIFSFISLEIVEFSQPSKQPSI